MQLDPSIEPVLIEYYAGYEENSWIEKIIKIYYNSIPFLFRVSEKQLDIRLLKKDGISLGSPYLFWSLVKSRRVKSFIKCIDAYIINTPNISLGADLIQTQYCSITTQSWNLERILMLGAYIGSAKINR